MPMAPREPPKNLREAIEAGDVLAVGSIVRTMSQEEAEVELVAQDRYVCCMLYATCDTLVFRLL